MRFATLLFGFGTEGEQIVLYVQYGAKIHDKYTKWQGCGVGGGEQIALYNAKIHNSWLNLTDKARNCRRKTNKSNEPQQRTRSQIRYR